MAIFDNKGANAALLAGLGLMGPRPFAGAQQGLMMAGQIGAQQAAERRAQAQADRQQAQFEQAQAREEAISNLLAGSGAPGPQYAQAGAQATPGGPINLLPPAMQPQAPATGTGNPLLANLGFNRQQTADLAALGSGALPIIQMMQAQRERQARLNQPGKLPQIAQLQAYRASLPEGDPRRAEVDAQIQRLGRAPSTNVSVATGDTGPQLGNIPPGYMLTGNAQEGYQMIPVPGSPAEAEQKAEAEAAEAAEKQERQGADLMLDEIGRSLELVEGSGLPTTGSIGGLLSNLPETDAGALRNRLQTIRANIGFDRLQRMREASPTGGALGNVTEGELARLEAVMGSLEQSQRKEDFLYNLRRLQDTYLDTIHGPGNRPEAPAEQPSGNQFQDMSADDLLSLDPSTITTDEALTRYEEALRAQGLI